MFADGSSSDDNSTFGAWMVMNTKDTYFSGPLHSDLVVDGIVYSGKLHHSREASLAPACIHEGAYVQLLD
jgi:hypothetical protein